MRHIAVAAILACAACTTPPGQAAPRVCAAWNAPEQAGAIDPAIMEASGLAVSKAFPARLYHHNDSGRGPKFFVTDSAGANLRTVNMANYKDRDIEDMSMGACGDAKSDKRTCLVFGDVGDNGSSRPSVAFILMPEKQAFADTETPLRVVNARYPDGPHNAEGFAIHPNGDLYLLTKTSPGPAQIFRLTRDQLRVSDGAMQTFTEVGKIDIAPLVGDLAAQRGALLVTSFDIAPDGKRAVILTYGAAIEIGFDLSKPLPPQSGWKSGQDFRRIDIAKQPQAEAIAYAPNGAILYDSERQGDAPVPLYRQTCRKP
jgi:hypothetical protein